MKSPLIPAAAFLLSPLLTASIAADAKSPGMKMPMLREDSRPPVFHLPDSAGKLISPASFFGRKRIVIVFSPPRSYLDSINGREYEERDLVVLAIFRPGDLPVSSADRPLYTLTDKSGEVFQQYHVSEGRPTFYLIGKDGGIKMASHIIPAEHELFGTIDAMPMRRQEMRERGR